MKTIIKFWYGFVLIYAIAITALVVNKYVVPHKTEPVAQSTPETPPAVQPTPPAPPPDIHLAPATYHSYKQVVAQLNQWHKEAPELTEVAAYGDDVYYIHLTNHTNQPKVVISAAIHANEVLSSMLNLQLAGEILKNHQDLLKTREIYFIPVFSPKSYPNEREVYGVDPNRNFPDPFVKNTPVPNVRGFCDFIQSIKPKAYISMHSFGRVLLTPWGDTDFPNPNHKDYLRIVQAMMKLNGYRTMRICENYGHPIYGVEADWCHRQGVFSIIMETGTHMGVPQDEEIEEELHRTLDSVILFIQQAPDVVIKQPETCPLPAEY